MFEQIEECFECVIMEERDYYLVDQKRLGQLTDMEQVEFDARMQDPNFEELVQMDELTNAAVKREHLEGLYEKMQDWDAKMDAPAQPQPKPMIPWVMAVALLVVLSFLVYWFIIKPVPEPEGMQLYAQYYEPYANVENPTLRSNAAQTAKSEAYQYYDQQEYEQAGAVFQELSTTDFTQGDKFYYAITLMEQDKFSEAKKLFEEVQDGSYKWPATWYLFLIALRTDDKKAVDSLGQTLIYQTEFPKFSEKANSILDALHK